MATKTTKTERDGLAVTAGVTLLLNAAADRCLSILATDPAPALEDSFALSDLGLGAQLAGHLARDLLPADVELGSPRPHQDDPLELVRAAEALTRTVPIETLPAGSSHLVVALCDLLREHS
ncbi:hypothetical protein FHX52_1719 [Humibacillus xanthopallidus]|uniref:Uncharacterized protein n=1 Tax=Humibacillus xanthopallidus TaxID=412689 RepID=A0A543PX15_9MICO|nr:hypothetical protein [Humibacillus xanthopallidus]TQN48580.1 hypothetical protein FHX52_1719 [Humibacillus xanthopallidus]